MSKKLKIVLGIGVLFFVVTLFLFYFRVEAGLPNAVRDVVGTKVGTTTTGVAFYNWTGGTTTYPTYIGGEIDTAIYTFKPTAASSSAAVSFNILASNDASCNTASTTGGTQNPILTKDINWFDASAHIKGLAGATTLPSSTTTVTWSFTEVGQNRQIVLTDLEADCLALRLSGTSTFLWVQLRTKQR